MEIATKAKNSLLGMLMLCGVVVLAENPALAYFDADDFDDIDCSFAVDADEIRFSQDSISSRFRNGNTVKSLIDELNNGDTDADDIDPIRIVKVDPDQVIAEDGEEIASGVYSLDNRRLYAFKIAGQDIACEKLDAIPQRERFKFTTDNNGTFITVRQ